MLLPTPQTTSIHTNGGSIAGGHGARMNAGRKRIGHQSLFYLLRTAEHSEGMYRTQYQGHSPVGTLTVHCEPSLLLVSLKSPSPLLYTHSKPGSSKTLLSTHHAAHKGLKLLCLQQTLAFYKTFFGGVATLIGRSQCTPYSTGVTFSRNKRSLGAEECTILLGRAHTHQTLRHHYVPSITTGTV